MFIETDTYRYVKSFFNSTFLQTVAVIVVGVLAYNVAIQQNDLSKQLTNLSYSPKYNEPLKFSVFESDIRIENVGRISLHNIDPSFIDLYAEHKSIIITGDTNTMMYNLEPGSTGIISIPDDLKAKSKTIFVSICYLFNENPLDRVDNFVSPIKLKNDPFYEYMRRVQAYHEHKCSRAYVKYDDKRFPVIR